MNGLCIQWGRDTSDSDYKTIQLFTDFSSGDSYVVAITFDWGTGNQNGYDKSTRVFGKSKSFFRSWTDSAGPIGWIAIGYA